MGGRGKSTDKPSGDLILSDKGSGWVEGTIFQRPRSIVLVGGVSRHLGNWPQILEGTLALNGPKKPRVNLWGAALRLWVCPCIFSTLFPNDARPALRLISVMMLREMLFRAYVSYSAERFYN